MNLEQTKTRISEGKPRQYPVWLTKACRAYLKRKGLDSRDLAGCVISRALNHWHHGLSLIIDHYGMIKHGSTWYFYTQPYLHAKKLVPIFSEFLTSLNITMFEKGECCGPHDPDTIYIEIGFAHSGY